MTNKPTWADEFDSQWDKFDSDGGWEKGWDSESKDKEMIKQFISTKLEEQRQEMVETVAKLDQNPHDHHDYYAYNNALRDVINLIKQK